MNKIVLIIVTLVISGIEVYYLKSFLEARNLSYGSGWLALEPALGLIVFSVVLIIWVAILLVIGLRSKRR